MSPYDFFMWTFPQTHLLNVLKATNARLTGKQVPPTTSGEVLRFFGILVLLTRLEFSERRSLWSSETHSNYLTSPNLGRIMSKHRFECLVECIAWSGVHTSPDEDRWSDVNGFVDSINAHRQANMSPGEYICVDESISRWYGLGGNWTNVGLPHYVKLD